MLTVVKVNAGQALPYVRYIEGKVQSAPAGDYYLRDGERVEAPGRWVLGPRGADAIGVQDTSGPVDPGVFRSLMAVVNPVTGEPLRRVGASGAAVCAIDATFSAPKSVSAVWALAPPELRTSMEAAHERAVDRAIAHASQYVPMVRRRVDGDTVVRAPAAEVIATSWRHTTARAVDEQPPDPQLHSHLVLHGAVRENGRVVAIESRAWMVHQREVDAAYLCELAGELERLGFRIERETGRGGRYFELAGVPVDLRERWSSRHRQVREAIERRLEEKRAKVEAQLAAGDASAVERLEALERSGRLTPAEERLTAVESRAEKGRLATEGDLDRAWWQTACEYGFDARSVKALRRAPGRETPAEELVDERVLERLTEFDATFAERDARATALAVAAGLGIDDALASLERLRDRGELVALDGGRLTTRAHRALERQTVARARDLAARPAEVLPDDGVEAHVARLDGDLGEHAVGAGLAPEQAEAIRVACSDRALVVLEGQAGTGKSTTLVGIARAHRDAARQIVVTSTGALAAERLAAELRRAGVQAAGYSTAALKATVDHGRLELRSDLTLIHDEAALASTREQHWLLVATEASGARLIAVGDPRQSQPVGAGGLWPQIQAIAQEREGYVELRRIVRARDPADRRDQALWRAGQHTHAMRGYQARERITLEAEQRQAEDHALEAGQADHEQGKRPLIIAQTSNERLDELNARAQAIRAQAGELGQEMLPVAGRPYGLRAGDEIQVRAPIRHPELGRVENGTTAHVAAVDTAGASAEVRLDDGRRASFDRELLDAGEVRLPYVQHPFPAQGATADTCHLICDRHATAEGTYVALTRARDHTHIYAGADRLEVESFEGSSGEHLIDALAERMARGEPEMPSIALPIDHERQAEVEHAQESRADEERLADLTSKRDRLRTQSCTFPSWAEALVHDHRLDVERLDRDEERIRERIGDLGAERDQLGFLARQSRRGRELEQHLTGEHDALARVADERQRIKRHIEQAQHHLTAWQIDHPVLDPKELFTRLHETERQVDSLICRRGGESLDRAEQDTERGVP